jgi:hypothetical protein
MPRDSPAREITARRRILIVDDRLILRHGLAALIDNEADLWVCVEVATEREGLEVISATLWHLYIPPPFVPHPISTASMSAAWMALIRFPWRWD